ncbi:Major Facilitator Superfamily protein, partial [Caloranaerobacter azorensis DSM 13643]
MNTERNRLYTYRWYIWGILALAYVIVFFHRVAAGVVRQDLIKAFNITDVEFGNLGSMYFYAYMIMQIPSGILADTLGARKTVSIGTLLAG